MILIRNQEGLRMHVSFDSNPVSSQSCSRFLVKTTLMQAYEMLSAPQPFQLTCFFDNINANQIQELDKP